MRAILDATDRVIARLLEGAVAVLLAAAAGLGIYQVLTRFVLAQPSTWSEALTRTLIIWMVYLGAALAVREGLLVSVDVLKKLVGPRMRLVVDLLSLAATLVFFCIVAWFGYLITWRVRFQNLAGLEIPISWAYAALPVGAALSVLVTLLVVARRLGTGRRKKGSGEQGDGA